MSNQSKKVCTHKWDNVMDGSSGIVVGQNRCMKCGKLAESSDFSCWDDRVTRKSIGGEPRRDIG